MYPKYRDATIQMLKNIHIKDPESVYFQYILSPELIAEFDQTNLIPLDKDQIGGGNKVIHYKFDNRDFVIYEAKASGGGYDFSIHKNDDVDDSSCLHVITHPKNNIAVIINISYHKDCVSTSLELGGGSILLKLAIQYLTEFKKKYNIKRIVLKDNSFFKCKKLKENISLALMHTLIDGHTWYGKYGFRPYDSKGDKLNIEANQFYEENIKIVQNKKIRDTIAFQRLYEIYTDIISKEYADKQKPIIYSLFKNHTIGNFFKDMLTNFQGSCFIFSMLYRKFAKATGITDFDGKMFFRDI
jgi:hypothetical protein